MRRTADYHFELPEGQIAQAPADRRDGSRLLALGNDPEGRVFAELPALLPEGAVVVANDSRVFPARLALRKDGSGGAVELLLVEPAPDHPDQWWAMARASKPIRAGARLLAGDGTAIVVLQGRESGGLIQVELPEPAAILCERIGTIPLPPYIRRDPGAGDAERYQTVYAREPGSAAAPTAGLHFTAELIERIEARGAAWAPITLHVGPGTFAPVRTEDVAEHRLHAERYEIGEETAALIASGRPVVAVGTTAVRALEAAAVADRRVVPGAGSTDLFIRPGHRFRAVDHLLTNFHLPRSSLLMLVCAFAGHEPVMAAYRRAVAAGYRFFSYGDAMLLGRQSEAA
jgi:S-adenosylmethionine:tRNA ribosyltransferase-isomerase